VALKVRADGSGEAVYTESKDYLTMLEMFRAWESKAEQLRSGEITQEDYDNWRYNYPNSDESGTFKKIVSSD
jgi:hypothetical protein